MTDLYYFQLGDSKAYCRQQMQKKELNKTRLFHQKKSIFTQSKMSKENATHD